MKKAIPFILALSLGLLALILIEPFGPDNEHWDNPVYWHFAYPAICIACGVLGFFLHRLAWSYGPIVICAQGLPSVLINLDAELIVVSITMLVILSFPPLLTGLAGSWVYSHFDGRPA